MILESKILALVNEVLGQNAKLRKGGLQATYYCPFCNHYKRKLEVNLSYGQWHCWVCHAKGSYLGSLFTKLKVSQTYRNQLFELTKDVRIHRKAKTNEEIYLSLPTDFISIISPTDSREYKAAISYLKQRRIGIDDICRYNIGYCETGEYRDCVVIPSYDDDGKLNYFSARHYYPHKWLKYQNAPFSKDIVGFECFINYNEPVTLVEGVFDAIAVRNNAIPMFGTYPSQKLVECLGLNRVKRVNICLDSDAAKEALDIYERLKLVGIAPEHIHLLVLPEKDPSVLGFEKIHELIEKSEPFEYENFVYLLMKIHKIL